MKKRSVAAGMSVGIALAALSYLGGILPLHLAMISVVLSGAAIAVGEAFK